jgi:hypothetical protein
MRLRLAKSTGPRRLAVDGITATILPSLRTAVITATSSFTAAFDLSGVAFRSATIAGVSTLAAVASRTIPRTVAIAAQSSLAASGGLDSANFPDLSTITADDVAETFTFTVDVPCQIYWMRYTGTAPNAATILAGGGIDSGNFAAVTGANNVEIAFATGDDGPQFIAFVARVEPDGLPSLVRTASIFVDTGGFVTVFQPQGNSVVLVSAASLPPGEFVASGGNIILQEPT